MIKKIILGLLMTAAAVDSFSQNLIKVPLKTYVSNEKFGRSTIPVSIQKSIGDYKGIPENLENYILGYLVFQKKQFYFNEYAKGSISAERYILLTRTNKLDTSDVSRENIKCYVGVLSYIIGSKKTIIADSDNDHDFSNENIYVYDSNSSVKSFEGVNLSFLPTISVSYEIYSKGKKIPKNSYLKIKPFDKAYSHKDTLLLKKQVYAVTYQYTAGSFTLDDVNYKILIDNVATGFEEDNRNPRFNLQLENKDFKYNESVKKDELVKIEGHEFKVRECSNAQDTVVLEYLGFHKTITGWQIGDHLPLTSVIDTKGNSIDFRSLLKTNDFLLLDFWGSWYAPCIKELPNIKRFALESSLNKIALISVAYETNEKGQESARERIAEFEMDWPQIIETNLTGKGMVKSLNIIEYPTLMLIDKAGVIVKKETGVGGLDRISAFLNINRSKD